MILSNTIEIKVHHRNIKKYPKNKIGDIIKVPIDDLSNGSNVKIDVRCENNLCNKEKSISYYDYNKATNNKTRKYYCNKCSYIHTKTTISEKYGVDNIMKLKSVQKKHKENILKIDQKISNEKRKITNKNKYGVDYVQQSKDINNKTKNTIYEKYGVDYIFHTEKSKIKSKKNSHTKSANNKRKKSFYNTIVEKIKEKFSIDIEDYNGYDFTVKCDKNENHSFKIYDTLLTNRKRSDSIYCTVCNPITKGSDKENKIKYWLKGLDIDYIENDRSIIDKKELDIYIPSMNLAIEFNGLYWHSELYKDSNYHKEKTELCEQKGINLLHIFEDDWIYKQDIVKSIIKNKLNIIDIKIYARKCIIKEVDSKTTRHFLDNNHIQGFSNSSYKLGLYYNDELVSLMTFGYRHTNSKKEFELIRFCNKINTNVIGAASKLFKHFIKNYSKQLEENYLISYADISLFDGTLYDTLGFSFKHRTKPNYFWIVDGIRYHRFTYNKQKLIKEYIDIDPNKTEREIMHEKGYYRIFSSGQDRYEYYF